MKDKLRKVLLKRRESFEQQEVKKASRQVVEKLQHHPKYIESRVIGLYYPFKNEIDLSFLLKDKKKRFVMPKIIDGKMVFVKHDGKTIQSDFGVLEPFGNLVESQIDLLIVPCVGITKNGYRLGYGKGHYDMYLALNEVDTIGVLYEGFLVEFEHEKYDIPLDEYILGGIK